MLRILITALVCLGSGAGCSLVVPPSRRTADFDAGGGALDAAPDTSDAARADVLLDVSVRDVPLGDVPLVDVPLVDVPLGDVPPSDAPQLDVPAAPDAPGLDAPAPDAPSDAGNDAPMADAPCTPVSGYEDQDGDGFGAGPRMTGCLESGLLLENEDTDCNDADRAVYPGASDTDCDGTDADCDGVTDPNEALVNAACSWGVCTPMGCDVPVEVEAGWYHTCARLGVTGELWCWGRNDDGEFGPGSPSGPSPIPFDTGVTAVVDHCTTANATCFIAGSRVRCFGNVATSFPLDFDEPAVGFTPVEIACGDDELCVRGSDGSVRCAGSNTGGQSGATPSSAPLTALTLVSVPSATQITVAANHACAVISGDRLACWGANDAGQLGRGSVTPTTDPIGVPIALTGVAFRAVEAMNFATCARTTANAVYCWGPTFEHQVIDRGAGASVLAPALSSSSVFASLHGGPALHACGLSTMGEIRCWGIGQSLALGRPNVSSSTPGLAMPGRSIAASDLAVGSGAASAHTCAIEASSGRLFCWGANDYGQCGALSSAPLANAVEVLP